MSYDSWKLATPPEYSETPIEETCVNCECDLSGRDVLYCGDCYRAIIGETGTASGRAKRWGFEGGGGSWRCG